MEYIIVRRGAGLSLWYYNGAEFQFQLSRAKKYKDESEAKKISSSHPGSYIVARKRTLI